MISVQVGGSFDKTKAFLTKAKKLDVIAKVLDSAGRQGVDALARATPIESGLAAHSWDYRVISSGGNFRIIWTNSDVENGFPVVVMLQYGHGTGTGGYVAGRDFINPAIRPVFDKIAQDVWKAVTSL